MSVFVTVCGAICTLLSIYFSVTSAGGLLLKKRRVAGQQPPKNRIAAIIPARNEAAVVGKLVESLLAQRYPRELFDVYVAPNNCSDDTEGVARAAGAQILRVEGPIHSKGDVLRQAFARLSATGRYDAYCVFDADNLVDPGFFGAVNDALIAGYRVAQGFRDSKNPFDSWISGSMSVFYWFMSRLFNESRARLGMSCHLNGTGFMVSDEAIRTIGWDTHTLTEDLEFTALSALAGFRVGWMPDARIYDEQTSRFTDSCVQRRRWVAGSLQCMRRYVPTLLGKRTVASLDMALLFVGNLICVIGLVPGVSMAFKLVPYYAAQPSRLLVPALSCVGYYLFCCAAAAVLFRVEGRLERRSLPGILGFPIFLISWMPINLVACFTPPPKWKEIRHDRGLDRPDI